MNIVQLRYAQAVLREGSFGAAARSCSVTQPALSNGIAALERSLGGRLFERSTRGVRPTPFGERILPLAAATVRAADLVLAEAKLSTSGGPHPLRVGISPLIGPGLVGRVFQAAGRVLPERAVILRSADLADLHRALDDGNLDVLLAPGAPPVEGHLAAVVSEEPVVVIGPPSVPGPRLPEAPIEISAVPMPLVLPTDACGLSPFTRRLFREGDVPLTTYPGQAHDCRILQDWVVLGLGTALLPASKAAAGTPARPLHLHGTPALITYQLSWAASSPLTTDLAKLAELIAQESTEASQDHPAVA